MRTLFAAIDCGTTAIKCALVDADGHLAACVSRPTPCTFLADEHIELNPDNLLCQIFSALRESLERSQANPADIASVCLATQRATVIAVDSHGTPLANAISWQDMRGTKDIEQMRSAMDDDRYYDITGLPNNPVFTLAKLLWIKNRQPSLYRKTSRFVLVHDFVLKYLGCTDFYTDWSNASLTGLLDVSNRTWSNDILKTAGLDPGKLPQLVPSGTMVGTVSTETSRQSGLLAGTPLISGGGDQQCAALGAGAVAPGILEFTLGTAGVSLCFSERVVKDPSHRVTCCVHAYPDAWEVEGLQNSAGGSLKWLAKTMSVSRDSLEDWYRLAAESPPGARGLLFYPYLTGSSAPHWDPRAKAMFLGLTQRHQPADLVRAVMEGVSIETNQVLDVFTSLEIPVEEIRLTGGYTTIDTWNQIQADIYGKPVSTLENPEASIMGAALLGAVGTGAFSSLPEAVKSMVRLKKRYQPARENAV
ncbi:MAG: FGGY family carbohydrate kinase, partial [bacterium]|nr:FGGY family carbohydrate kinase [bacterium]